MIRRKSLAKALAITLSVSMLGSNLQVAGSVVQAEEVQETSEAAQASVKTDDDSDKDSSQEVVEEPEEAENSSASASTSDSEEALTEKTSSSEEESSKKQTTEEETTEESSKGQTNEEETTEEASTEEMTLMMLLDEDVPLAYSVELSQGDDGYDNFKSDKVIASFEFGVDVNTETIYSDEWGYGFSDVDFNTDAKGWSGSVYYPRVANITKSTASYVKAEQEGMLAIDSKVWTETESTGYGVYTYENTSTFDIDVYNADYQIDITFENPTDNAYTAYVEAEDITRKTDITVNAGESRTVSGLSSKVCKFFFTPSKRR